MLVDYHLHSPYCGHARGKIIEYINRGIAEGLTQIGFAEHLFRYYLTKSQRNRHWDWGITPETLSRYVNELCELKDYYADDLTIRIGLEVDYIEGAEDFLEPIIGAYPLDFLLGSVHCLPSLGWKHLSHYQPQETGPLYAEYFALVVSGLKSRLFQSLAHPDYIWRCFKLPKFNPELIAEDIDNVVKTALACNTCLELSAAGYLWSLDHQEAGVPSLFETLLDCVARTKLPITMGSDAHAPEIVGRGIAELAEALKRKGISQVMTFDRKKRIPVTLG